MGETHLKRIRSELGGHKDAPKGALTKYEVATALCHVGFGAGLWSIPEFEIQCAGGRRTIDVVWARRNTGKTDRLWDPVAAFEIEGHNVNSRIKKNVESLCAAADAGAKVLAMVLFQVGPNGTLWHPFPNSAKVRKFDPAAKLKKLLPTEYADRIETVHDANLFKKLEGWQKEARKLRRRDAR